MDHPDQIMPTLVDEESLLEPFHDFTVIVLFQWAEVAQALDPKSGEMVTVPDLTWETVCVRVKATDSTNAPAVALAAIEAEMDEEIRADPPHIMEAVAVFAGWHENQAQPLSEEPEEDEGPITG